MWELFSGVTNFPLYRIIWRLTLAFPTARSRLRTCTMPAVSRNTVVQISQVVGLRASAGDDNLVVRFFTSWNRPLDCRKAATLSALQSGQFHIDLRRMSQRTGSLSIHVLTSYSFFSFWFFGFLFIPLTPSILIQLKVLYEFQYHYTGWAITWHNFSCAICGPSCIFIMKLYISKQVKTLKGFIS